MSDELRRCDPSLDDDQQAVKDAFAGFFEKESLPSVVRAAEPLGFDAALWAKLTGMGAASMGLPSGQAGDDATLADLVLVAEQWGCAVAPVPFASHVAATRLLGRAGAPAGVLRAAASGRRICALALEPAPPGASRLVADAAVAPDVLTFAGGELTLHQAAAPAPQAPNSGSAPVAWWPGDAESEPVTLARGTAAERAWDLAAAEWKLLTAAALAGMADAALRLGLEFARTRETLGVPIGALQGIAFPLADIAIDLAGARTLAYKAAWTLDHEPGDRKPEGTRLALAALDVARRLATSAATTSVHVQGGLGFTAEADISLYFLRAKAWAAAAGNPAGDLVRLGADLVRNASWTSG